MSKPDATSLAQSGLTALHATYRKQVDAWIRPSGEGWWFIDNSGQGYSLNQTDGTALHAAAHERVDELFTSLDGNSWLTVLVAMVLGEGVIWLLGQLAVFGEMPGIVYVLPVALYLFKDAIAEIEYAFAMHKLRAQIARQLGGDGRGDAASAMLFELSAANLLLAGGGALLVTWGLAGEIVTDQTLLLKLAVGGGAALTGGLLLKFRGG